MVKRVSGLWPILTDIKTIAKAYLKVRKGHELEPEIIKIDQNPMPYLEKVRKLLITRTYTPSQYYEYDKLERGKMRHIAFLPYFPDQIIGWAWKIAVEPEINKRLISQTYGSVKGRGQHRAMMKVKEYLETGDDTEYCLEFDVHHCFESITADMVMRKFRRKFKEPEIQWLTSTILHGFHEGDELPLGNVTSHPLANLVLDDIDRLIKEEMHARKYVRFLDNGWVVGKFTHWLRRVQSRVSRKMRGIGLTMKSNWQIYPVESRGIKVLGYRVFHKYILLVTKTKKRLQKYLGEAIERMKRGEDPTQLDLGRYHSYCGVLKYCNSWRLSKSTTRLFERLWKARTWMQSPQHRTRAPSSS